VVEEFGVGREARHTETILLVGVCLADAPDVVVADHVWFKKGAAFRTVARGDVVEFDAEVEPYDKGYVNFRQGIDETTTDYRLAKPANIAVVPK
jgi:hypothetical protein